MEKSTAKSTKIPKPAPVVAAAPRSNAILYVLIGLLLAIAAGAGLYYAGLIKF